MKRQLQVVTSLPESPAITAERLLKSVLPEEAYVSLVATGAFICVVNGHEYTLSRKKKTTVRQDDKLYSCCIDVDDSNRPEQDRIIAEYLLILNDEVKYLKTANLTLISPPMAPPPPDLYWNYEAPPSLMMPEQMPRRYQIRPPLLYRMNVDANNIPMLVEECLMRIVNHVALRGVQFPVIPRSMLRNPEIIHSRCTPRPFGGGDFPFDLVINPLIQLMLARPVLGISPLELPAGQSRNAATRTHQDSGISVLLEQSSGTPWSPEGNSEWVLSMCVERPPA